MKPAIPLPPTKRLLKLLEIDPSIPNGLRWKAKASRNTIVGSPAGRKSLNGYWEVRIDRILYKTHRIIYKMYTGIDPIGLEIDHIDRNPSNNDPANLITANRSDQQCNSQVRGAVPYRNVCFDKRKNKYMASVTSRVNGSKVYKFLGYFENPYQASLAALEYKCSIGMRFELAPSGTM